MSLDPVDLTILRRLEDRPSWRRSLSVVKPRVDRLIRLGLAQYWKPPTGTAHNMVAITPEGQDALDRSRA